MNNEKAMEALIQGAIVLIRNETHKFKYSPRERLERLEQADRQLQKVASSLATPTLKEEEPEAPDTRSIRIKVQEKICGTPEGFTCDELCARFNLPHQSVSPRINELRNAGLIQDSGRTRETRQGKPGTVWIKKGETK